MLPPQKSLFHSEKGVPIGNVTSQTLSNFVTTGYLRLIEEAGFDFAFYTDDTGMFCHREDKDRLLSYLPIFEDYLKRECGLKMHPNKRYIQDTRKGFNAFGFRIKGRNITPSKRLVYNFKRLVGYLLLLAEEDVRNLYLYREQAQARLNSYLGLLRWSHSYNLRKAQMIRLQASKWAQIFRFPVGYEKVEIKASKSKMEHYRRLNKVRYRQQLSISNAI